MHADQLFWLLEDLEAPPAEQLTQQGQQQEAAAALRHLLAAAVACQAPVLSAEAQEFLGKPNRGAEQWVMSALHACTALHAGVWCLCLSQQLALC
jgi:hypothetical protein